MDSEVVADTTIPDFPQLYVSYRGRNAGAGLQFISIWNWNTMSWVAVDARVVATSEVFVEVRPPGFYEWAYHGMVAFVKVTTIGNFTASSTDELRMSAYNSH